MTDGRSKQTHFSYSNGWLDPSGRFYPLPGDHEHCPWCEKNSDAHCRSSDERTGLCRRDYEGWFKLTNGKWIIASPSKITRCQCDFIIGWHLHNQKDLREFNELIDES